MKKLILIISIIVFSINLNAQSNNGKWMIGANIFTNSNTNDNSENGNFSNQKNNSATVSLNGGYFTSDNFAIGMIVSFQNNNQNYNYNNGNSKQNNYSYNIGINSRYYKMFNASKFGLFVQLSASYITGKLKSEYNTNLTGYYNSKTTGDVSGYQLYLAPGIVYYLTNKIGIETQFCHFIYNNSKTENTTTGDPAVPNPQYSTDKSNSFSSYLTISALNLGISYYLGRGKSASK